MIRFLLFLIIILLNVSCSETDISTNTVRLNLNRKELTKLFKGQELYSIKGIKCTYNKKPVRVKSIPSKDDYILVVDFKKNFYKGSKEIILHSNPKFYNAYSELKWFIDNHKLTWLKFSKTPIEFNGGLIKEFTVINAPIKESIEFNGSRFIQKLAFSDSKGKFIIEQSEIENLLDIENCYGYDYNSLIVLSEFMTNTQLKLSSFEGIKIIPNPITNTLEFVIDFTYFTDNQNGIDFKTYLERLGQLKPINTNALLDAKKLLKEETINVKHKTIKFNGHVNLREDLVINNATITVEAGTIFNLYNTSKLILKNSTLNFLGTKDNPILLKGNGKNSLFIENVDTSIFNYVDFINLSNWNDNCKSVPSSITVYNSKCEFNHCNFIGNLVGDDMINLFHSEFSFKNCVFEDIFSDALDSDFSTGTISETTFNTIGNDAIDCSGSKLQINNTIIDNVEDKAISAGENTHILVSNSTITNCALGFVSKDGSSIEIKDNFNLKNNDLDFAVFIKKPFYDYPKLTIKGKLSTYNYLIQKNSIIKAEDIALLDFSEEVESRLYGNEYGKSSK